MKPKTLERGLFATLVALLVLFDAWLIFTRRLPRGHDTLSLSYVLQYLFLSQSAAGGGIPLWLPYASHGILTSWYVGMGGGLFQDALLLVGVRPGANAQVLFTLGQFVEELLLLVGTWRLGVHFFRSPWARFFVAASVVGSSIWAEQIWHNHRAVIAVPLALSLLLDFLETGRRRSLFLGLNLLVLQFLGNIPYTAVLTILVTVTFSGVYAIVFRRRLNWSAMRPRPVDAAIVLANAALLAAIAAMLTSGTGEVAFRQQGRTAEGTVGLDQFLTHAGGLDPVRFVDLALGLSPLRDYTLYVGAAAIPLAILGIALRPGRKALFLVSCVALVLLLSLGYLSFVAMIAYYAAPPLRFYRYLCTAGVHVRIPLLFLAGLGIDGLLRHAAAGRPARKGAAVALALLGLGCFALIPEIFQGELTRLVQTPVAMLGVSSGFDRPDRVAGVLVGAGLAALAGAGLIAAAVRRPDRAAAIVALLVMVQTADLARWRIELYRHRTAPLTPEQFAAQECRPLPYIARRSFAPADDVRARGLGPDFFGSAAVYDVTENFIPRDPPAAAATAPFWMSSTDRLLQAYARTESARPTVWRGAPVRPPYDKILGIAADKLQVFRAAHAVENAAELMNRAEFRGDVLLIDGPTSPLPSLSADERLAVPVEVAAFDANSLRVRVRVPERAWLLYCDAWHSSWRATVNAKPVPVSRAFLAYKAVPLETGANEVEFRIESPVRVWTFRLAALSALLWVAGVLGLTVATIFRKAA
jgi:hypothetical protein